MVKIGPRFHPRRWSTPQAPPPKLALLIGIDYVDAPQDAEYPPLRRARSDTRDFRDLLISAYPSCSSTVPCGVQTPAPSAKYEYRPENIIMMLDGEGPMGMPMHLQPTRANIVSLSVYPRHAKC